MNLEVSIRVQKALDDRLAMILLSEGSSSNYPPSQFVHQKWNECLESVGARRIGKLLSIMTQPEPGFIRLKDPLGHGEARGVIEMDEETFNKIATLGVP